MDDIPINIALYNTCLFPQWHNIFERHSLVTHYDFKFFVCRIVASPIAPCLPFFFFLLVSALSFQVETANLHPVFQTALPIWQITLCSRALTAPLGFMSPWTKWEIISLSLLIRKSNSTGRKKDFVRTVLPVRITGLWIWVLGSLSGREEQCRSGAVRRRYSPGMGPPLRSLRPAVANPKPPPVPAVTQTVSAVGHWKLLSYWRK